MWAILSHPSDFFGVETQYLGSTKQAIWSRIQINNNTSLHSHIAIRSVDTIGEIILNRLSMLYVSLYLLKPWEGSIHRNHTIRNQKMEINLSQPINKPRRFGHLLRREMKKGPFQAHLSGMFFFLLGA